MHPSHLAALGAALLISGARNSAPPPGAAERIAARVRFANHLTGTRTWSLASNGTVMFSGITPGTTTGYIENTDTLSTLSLRRDGTDSVFFTSKYPFVGGSYYTVTATYDNGDRPLLNVERDIPPRDTMP